MKTILPVLVGVSLALAQATAQAEETEQKPVKLSIERQSLRDALNEWAQQTGNQLIAEIKSDIVAPKVIGTLTAEEGLERLLKGTSLTYRWMGERLVAVSDKPMVVPALHTSTSDTIPQIRVARLAEEGFANERASAGNSSERHAATSGGRDRDPIEELEEVVVTGTHIHTTRNQTIPALVFTRKDIEKTGYSTAQAFVRSLPQNFAGGGVSEDGVLGNGVNSGRNFTQATSIDLRGLGPSSTLVLIDGHRVAPTVFGSVVDISVVPLSAVDRVEIVTDGSSAIYGSDAVAGVVNIRMRHDYEGAETRLRYGSVTTGGMNELLAVQTLGTTWGTGNVLFSGQYQDADPLDAGDRSFRGTIPPESQFLPESRSVNGIFTLNQQLGEAWELSSSALMSRRDVSRFLAGPTGNTLTSSADVDSDIFSVQLAVHPVTSWRVTLDGQYSSQRSDESEVTTDEFGESPGTTDQRYRIAGASLIASSEPLQLGSADISVAIGGEYRDEKERNLQVFPFATFAGEHSRQVTAAFGEAYLSLIDDENSVGTISALDVSASIRYDDYSDFGSTTNYRVGAHISPAKGLNLRAGYSTSFRAPNTLELTGSGAPLSVLVIPFESSTGFEPGFFLVGGGHSLTPEQAESWSAGLDYTFPLATQLRIGANYYDIRFQDRIINPPFVFDALLDPSVYGPLLGSISSDTEAEAFLDAVRANGGTVIDTLGTGGAGVRSTYDQRIRNASRVHQTGIDFWLEATKQLGIGELTARANVATIDEIENQFTMTASPDDLVDTFAAPVDLRARLDLGLSHGGFLTNIGLNYTDAYTNTVAPNSPKIGSWTTVDFMGRLDLSSVLSSAAWKGTALSLTVQNIFDEDPPFVDASAVGINVQFDQANATALGRFIALQVEKNW